MAYHYVTYEDAQILIPALETIKSNPSNTKDIRTLAGSFADKLGMVREDVDYTDTRGYQMHLTDKESEVFSEVLKWARGK